MTILGVDPSLNLTGLVWVIRSEPDYAAQTNALARVAKFDIIAPPAHLSPIEKLTFFADKFAQVVTELPLSAIAWEEALIYRSLRASVSLLELQGIAKVIAAKNQIPIYTLHPTHIKKLITGNGHADKKFVQQALTPYFLSDGWGYLRNEWEKIRSASKREALYDALACAIAYIFDVISSKTREVNR